MTRIFDRGWSWAIRGLGLVGLVVGLLACGSGDASEAEPESPLVTTEADTMTIRRVLQTDDRFSTLVAALDSVDLDSTLSGDGPYTLFAPPNAAFEALPDGTMQVLLAERLDRLRTILAHHVVAGRVGAEALADTTVLTTLSGDSLRVHTDTTLAVGNAPIVDGDIAVDNGLIHVIDQVLRPPASEGE
jgi:uncharacterized surface protein with fasciclin (FAS1) repeats